MAYGIGLHIIAIRIVFTSIQKDINTNTVRLCPRKTWE